MVSLRYNQSVERVLELEKAGALFAIRPQEALKIGRLEKDPKKFQEIYDRGLEDGCKVMAELQHCLEK